MKILGRIVLQENTHGLKESDFLCDVILDNYLLYFFPRIHYKKFKTELILFVQLYYHVKPTNLDRKFNAVICAIFIHSTKYVITTGLTYGPLGGHKSGPVSSDVYIKTD